MTTELRVLDPAEYESWTEGLLRALLVDTEPPEERELWRELTEFDRSLAAWDGDDVVGSASALSFRMSVPGGAVVPTAGVTMVHVAATHRRRGLLRSMMRRQLDDIHEAGTEPLAALTASEPQIYGRFGYGLATRKLLADIDTSRVTLDVPPEADDVRLRFVADPASVWERCEAVYARRVGARAGMLERGRLLHRLPLLDPERQREGALPLACVLAERDGEVTGYARYFARDSSDAYGVPRGTVALRDLEALDPASYGALWRYLFDLDLTTTLVAHNRPVDDAWQHMVSDVRQCGLRYRDALFLRPVDVGAALAARTYTVPVDVVLEVEDAFCPWNAGRWRLSGDAKGASCERTRDGADVALSVRELGAAYLGGESLGTMAFTGRVRELREGALAAASSAFLSDPLPWLPHGF
ncbi:GNAT family N-acetyltransferase [Streptomyces daliensis]|uniref:GNAT family N-acetyltransferase n=1 Tax=Streptomyces daliensis TaxID=299421 RepID=A0A8T4IUU7_9ACTN|nr:GNAT family N-acetyltransferase [Streptomyces daliensis]